MHSGRETCICDAAQISCCRSQMILSRLGRACAVQVVCVLYNKCQNKCYPEADNIPWKPGCIISVSYRLYCEPLADCSTGRAQLNQEAVFSASDLKFYRIWQFT